MAEIETPYDLAIIGAGTGNGIITDKLDHWRIALIEKSVFGGTCLNRGCIPSKMFVRTADIAETIRDAERFGVDATLNGIRWADVRERVFGRIDPLGPGSAEAREEQANVDLFRGEAVFADANTLTVGDQKITADRFVLAAGARPFVPQIPGLDSVEYHTTDSIMRLEDGPEHLIIVGGGFIAAEMAHIFGGLGAKVTILARGDRLLGLEDDAISHAFTKEYQDRFDIRLNTSTQQLSQDGNDIHVQVQNVDGGTDTIVGDTLLMATGRIPNTDRLGVAAAGVETDDRGFVLTDDSLRTNVDHIWAIGDMTNRAQLKHYANAQLSSVAHNIVDPDNPIQVKPRFVPHAVFAEPQVAAVGQTEQQLIESGTNYIEGHKYYSGTAFGWALEDKHSFARVYADPETRLLLGAHIIGPQASLLIQPLILGMEMDLTIDQMAKGQIYIHPALTEVVENALLNLG